MLLAEVNPQLALEVFEEMKLNHLCKSDALFYVEYSRLLRQAGESDTAVEVRRVLPL